MTHAFFKALLFLAAGSAIIGMHHDQDMRHMGNLKKYMPITWLTMLIGNLSLIGTPFFSGFYSKDSIIEAAKYSTLPGSGFAYFAVLASVFVTAFYAFRQYFMVFHGEEKWRRLPEHHDDHHGEEHHGLGKKRQSARKPAGCYPAFDFACHSVRHHRLRCHRAYALRRFLQRRDFC